MFRRWKSSVIDPIGMFEEWGLDQMMRRHRTRMATFYRDGVVDVLSQAAEERAEIHLRQSHNENPYLTEEHGIAATPGIIVNEGESPNDTNVLSTLKMYHQWLNNNAELSSKPSESDVAGNFNQEQASSGNTLFEDWTNKIAQILGMYVEWRRRLEKLRLTESAEETSDKDQTNIKPIRVETMSAQEATAAVLKGDIRAATWVPRRQVRLCVVSTFVDTKSERYELMSQQVYHDMRQLCAGRGVEFMAVDLGWGQADGVLSESDFSELCLAELQKCMSNSLPIPCVLLFITDKYGDPGLPQSIPEGEMRHILELLQDEDARAMVERWYIMDKNAIPPAYRLQKPQTETTIIAPDKIERRAMSAHWSSMESRLLAIIQQAIEANADISLSCQEAWKTSAFGRQIAFCMQEKDICKKCVCVVRNIAQLRPFVVPNDRLNRRILPQYADLKRCRSLPDERARTRLHDVRKELKAKRVRCNKYVVNWNPFGISECTHEPYIEHMVSSLRRQLLTRATNVLDAKNLPDKLVSDVASHSMFCTNEANNFAGRSELVDRLQRYTFTCTRDEPSKLLVLHGIKGSGKTALLAKCCADLRQIIAKESEVDPVVAVRFCGLSKRITTRTLLLSLCDQIHRSYMVDSGTEAPTMKGTAELYEYFANLLERANSTRPLVVLLDSLDDVRSGLSGGIDLTWLPSGLPAYVRIIVSVRSDSDVHRMLEGRLDDGVDAMTNPAIEKVEVPILSVSEAQSILNELLVRARRTLTKEQHGYILNVAMEQIDEPPTVLRLKLLYDLCKDWRSYEVSESTIPPNVSTLYSSFLLNLELDHGNMVVARCLGLLQISRHGLSETELMDVLSGDEELLESVLLVNQPPLKRFPQSILSKLLVALRGHLAEISYNGRSVLAIANRQLAEAVCKRYLDRSPRFREKYCGLLADFFSGAMYDRYPGRGIMAQPLVWINEQTGQPNFNQGKLNELPSATIGGPFPSRVLELLCDLRFIASKCAARLADELLEDYFDADVALPGDQRLLAFWSFVQNHKAGLVGRPQEIVERALGFPADSPVRAAAKTLLEKDADATSWTWDATSLSCPDNVRNKRCNAPPNIETDMIVPPTAT